MDANTRRIHPQMPTMRSNTNIQTNTSCSENKQHKNTKRKDMGKWLDTKQVKTTPTTA